MVAELEVTFDATTLLGGRTVIAVVLNRLLCVVHVELVPLRVCRIWTSYQVSAPKLSR
jgi:hypothetical protein